MKKFVLLFTVLLLSVLSMGQSIQISRITPIGFAPNMNGTPPPQAGPISGPTSVCVPTMGVAYSIDPLPNADFYVWFTPPGTSIASGLGTNAITVDYPDGATSGNVIVFGENVYGAGQASIIYVTTNDRPVITLSGNTSVCEGSTGNVYTTESGMTNYTWAVSPGGSITAGGGPANNTVTVTWNTTAAQWVSVNYASDSGCTATVPKVLNITMPAPVITGETDVCKNDIRPYSTEPGKTGYSWVINGGQILSGNGTNSVSAKWDVPGSRYIKVTYTDGTCTQSSSLPVTVHPNMPGIVTSGGQIPCINTSATYNTEPGNSGYIWTVSSGGTITGGGGTSNPFVTVLWNTIGAQSVSVTYTPAYSLCPFGTTTVAVTVQPLPVPVINGPSPVCAVAGNVYSTQPGFNNYLWTVSSGGTVTAGLGTHSITVTWNTPGAQTVSVNYNSVVGCTAASPTVKNVTVNAPPVITFTAGVAAPCVNSTGNVYSTQTGMTNYVWAVSAGGTITSGGTSTSSSVTVTWNTTGVKTVSVNYANSNNCTAAAPAIFNVNVQPLPLPTITGPAVACATSTGNVYATEPGMSGYSWNVSSGGNITSGGTTNSITVNWNTAGPQTVTVNYLNLNNCAATVPASYPVTVYAIPVPTITGPVTPPCKNSTGNIYYTESGKDGYNWNISSGGTITAGAGTNTITVTWNNSGAQWVSVTYSSNGCAAAAPTVFNFTIIGPTITGESNVCKNDIKPYSTESGKSGYSWEVNGGSILSGNGTNSVSVKWDVPGSRYIKVTYTDGTCTESTTLPVTVYPNMPGITTSGGQTPCVNTSATYNTEPGFTGYIWTVSSGGTITAGGGTSNPFVTVLWNTAGAQSVSVTYTPAYALCPFGTTSVAVTVQPLPVPVINGPSQVCPVSGYVYSTQPGFNNYQWIVSSGGNITAGSGTNSITVTWNTPGAQTVSVNYNSVIGCTAASPTVKNVTVNAPPVITFTAGVAAPCVNSTGNVYSTQTGMTNYAWAVSAGGTITSGGTSTSSSVTVTWSTTGAKTVSVNYANSNNCTAAAPAIFNVDVQPLPLPTIAGPAESCATTAGNVYSTEPGMSGYSWNVSSGGTITSGGTTNSITVTWNTAGPQTVTVNYLNLNNCAAAVPASYNVTVYPVFVVGSIGSDQSITTGSVPSQLIGVAPTGGITPYTYKWQISTDNITFNDIAPPATGLNYQPPALFQNTWYQLIQTSAGPCGSLTTNKVMISVDHKISGILSYDDATHTPLPGFTVYLKTDPGNVTVGSAVTDVSGYYEITAPSGNYKLSAAPPPGSIYYAEFDDAMAIFDYVNGDLTVLNDALKVSAGDVADPLTGIPDLDDFLAVFFFVGGDDSYYSSLTPSWKFENPPVVVTNSAQTKNFMGLHSGNVTGSYPSAY